MLNVSIDFTNPDHDDVVTASGSLRNLIIDVTAVINGIYTQLKSSSPPAAEAFRTAVTKMITDPSGAMWDPVDGQTGLSIHNLTEEEEE